MVKWVRQPDGSLRCYVMGHRLHHGMVGAWLAAAGAALLAHDWRDFPFTRH